MRPAILRLWIAQQLLVECAEAERDLARSRSIARRAGHWAERIGRLEDRACRALGLRTVVEAPCGASRRIVRAITGLRMAFAQRCSAGGLARDLERSMARILALADDCLLEWSGAPTDSRSRA